MPRRAALRGRSSSRRRSPLPAWHSSATSPSCSARTAALVWEFKELCDRHELWPVFYEASATSLSLYVDTGLAAVKFGEEARVSLADLSLEGGAHKKERYLLRTLERDGTTFEVVDPSETARLLPELAAISDEWLQDKKASEKGFSLGCFDPEYLAQFPTALARSGGAIVAFANLWCTEGRDEVSPDLMRFSAAAPASVMEYLFLQLALWAKGEGYGWLNLGMAPLAGIEARASAPLWNRLGSLAFHYGEQFYHFQGLRQFKEKFHPEWRPKYLVYPGGVILPRVLTNVTALVSGGLRRIVRA
jgi:phosphatidylglycerol lysyltransferase